MRPTIRLFMVAPVLVIAAACSKDKPADASLNNDLTLAAQAKQSATLDSITAVERLNAANAATAAAAAPRPTTVATAPAVVHHTTVHHRSTSSGSSGSSSGNVAVSEPREVTVKNTKRDAAIGAAAGAVIGATTGHGLKGGIIGAAAGGILGGVIGNNVDIHKKKAP